MPIGWIQCVPQAKDPDAQIEPKREDAEFGGAALLGKRALVRRANGDIRPRRHHPANDFKYGNFAAVLRIAGWASSSWPRKSHWPVVSDSWALLGIVIG